MSAMVVQIDGVTIKTQELTVFNVGNSTPDSCTMLIPESLIDTDPAAGQEVKVFEGSTSGTVLFGGIIVNSKKAKYGEGLVRWDLRCSDYQKYLDRKLVSSIYTDETCLAIIEDIISNYADPALGFTTNNVDTGITIEKISFDYKPISECIRVLAEIAKFEWYVDVDKDIHFYRQESVLAPFNITDVLLGSEITNYVIGANYSTVRNSITVRGGYELSDPYTETQTADGIAREWGLKYVPTDLTMTEGGVAKTIGEENIDVEADFDYMVNTAEKVIRCSDHYTTPVDTTAMAFTYKYKKPVIAFVEDYASQIAIAAVEGGDGVYEHIIRDETLSSRTEAQDRAVIELNAYARPAVAGSFTTFYDGFRAGQTITLDRTGDTLNGNYQIKSVTIQNQGTNNARYDVTFASVQVTFEDFLIGMNRKQDRVDMRADETIDKVMIINETLEFEETDLTANLQNHPHKWGPGPDTVKWSQGVWG